MQANTFTVELDSFQGPLDLLLQLIEKRKLHISDVSLSTVTDDFIDFVNEQNTFPVGQTAHFLLIASTLLLLKSKLLLPQLTLTNEEEGNIIELEERLRLYRLFKRVGAALKLSFNKQSLFSKEPSAIERRDSFSPGKTTTPFTVNAAIVRVLLALPKEELLPENSVRSVISLDEMIARLIERVSGRLDVTFTECTESDNADKVGKVVGFLALLELMRRGMLRARQTDLHGEIFVSAATPSTPKYS